MGLAARTFFAITIATYFGFFAVEAVLWPLPFVQSLLTPQLNPTLAEPVAVQARILRSLFINQGVYNLLLALGGCAALGAAKALGAATARAMCIYLCIFAIVAALTLLTSTHAYLLGVTQAVFPVLTLVCLWRERHSSKPAIA